MQTLVKVHCTKLCCLLLLLLVWGALLPAYACSPEVDKAIAELQKSARLNISAEEWLVQVIDIKSTFFDPRPERMGGGGLGTIIGAKIVQKKLWTVLFHDKRSLVYLKKYLAEAKIHQNNDRDGSPFRKFSFNGKKYNYYYRYPSSDLLSVNPETACQLRIALLYSGIPVEGEESGETAFIYIFGIVDGKMKLIKNDFVG